MESLNEAYDKKKISLQTQQQQQATRLRACLKKTRSLLLGVSPQQDNSHECYDSGLKISFSLMVNATDYHASQARSELRFWRGAEVDKVKNPKHLFVISLEKVRKSVNFCNFAGAPQAKNDFCENFGAFD